MGGAASIENRNQQQNLTPQNKIFIDEGVGIEASQISRKWTTKLSLFKNIDGKQNMSEISNRPINQQKLQQQVSLVYSSDESLSDPSYPMNPMIQDSDDDHQLIKKEIHPQDYKKITTFQSVSDDSDIEERYLHYERKHSKTQNQKNSFSDDDSQQSKEGPIQRLREQMLELLDQISERESVDTQQDLQFVDQLDLSDIMSDCMQQKQQLPPQFPLRRLYMRSRLGGDKMQVGQEKKVRFDAKQEQIYENDDFSQKIQKMKYILNTNQKNSQILWEQQQHVKKGIKEMDH